MYYYQPPKSASYGHSLQRMSTERAKTVFEKFLTNAVSEFKPISASLVVFNPSSKIIPIIEHLIGPIAKDSSFITLTQEQFEKCLSEIITKKELTSSEMKSFMLMQALLISKWNINGQDIATESLISMYYGQIQCIATILQFDTIEQFQYIKQVFDDLGLCKLNEKHLKVKQIKKN
jgi:hypothetical protein